MLRKASLVVRQAGLGMLLLVALAGCGNKPSEGLTIPPGQTETWCSDGTTYYPCKETAGASDFTVSNHGPGTVTVTPPTHEAQVYAELWRICKERKLSFHVSDVTTARANYEARAKDRNDNMWISFASGPTEAAEGLLKKLHANSKPDIPQSIFDTGEVKP